MNCGKQDHHYGGKKGITWKYGLETAGKQCWSCFWCLFQYVPENLLPVYRDKVVPLADILTPNQFEAEWVQS